MSADHSRDPRSIPRAVAALGLVILLASLLVLLMDAGRARGFAADRDRRAREVEAREPELYRQLAHRDGVLESQRQVYIWSASGGSRLRSGGTITTLPRCAPG